MEVMTFLFAIVTIGIIAACIIDLITPNRQINKMLAALMLITFGATFLLYAVQLALSVAVVTATVNGKEFIGVSVDDFMQLTSALGIGSAGMAIITGGFSLITSGKFETVISSSEPISGVEIKK